MGVTTQVNKSLNIICNIVVLSGYRGSKFCWWMTTLIIVVHAVVAVALLSANLAQHLEVDWSIEDFERVFGDMLERLFGIGFGIQPLPLLPLGFPLMFPRLLLFPLRLLWLLPP